MIKLLQKVKHSCAECSINGKGCLCMLSRFSHIQLFATPWTAARLPPLSTSGLPCPSPGDLPNPEIEPLSPWAPALQADSLLMSQHGSIVITYCCQQTIWKGRG